MPALVVEPATVSRWADLQAVLGGRGAAAKCQCQRAILPLREYWYMPPEMREAFLRKEVGRRQAAAPGLIGYLDDRPMGWCRLAPRSAFAPLRNSPVPWSGRDEDRDDPGIWAVVCFAVRAGHRRQGVSGALTAAAVDYARERGARAFEGYPMATGGGDIAWGELHVGAHGAFQRAGFREVSHPTPRRYVMRIDF
ncbi:GNAT family N-acetyltransferase [Luteimonas saliphila]|uniref:GNAT family N-acetyltransferase n=1 Tax=Luteimonas saliphila TaxID=2804919 RepID=UPI00192D912C|nr:GNAT family N-acetyltransferase [Luteimonas saliphila]